MSPIGPRTRGIDTSMPDMGARTKTIESRRKPIDRITHDIDAFTPDMQPITEYLDNINR